jgi:nitroimidazol reductase NimA-like FMN-containing flavoprotein (pyridoxamine 5'-phosphate oxidase superfamily)
VRPEKIEPKEALMSEQLLQLTAAECEDLLRAGRVGRVAVCTQDGPHVIPVNYTVMGASLVVRTTPYSVLGTYARDALVAVEIDHIDVETQSGWSVLVRGRAVPVVDPDEVAEIRRVWTEQPWAAGMRTLFLRLRWTELTGRRLTPSSLVQSP